MVGVLQKLRSAALAETGSGTIANALPMPVMLLGSKHEVLYANPAAEQFFDTGLPMLRKQTLADLIAPHSPLFQLVLQAAERNASAAERDIDLSTPRHGERLADVTSAGPSRVFGIAGKGRIALGYDADFTIADLKVRRRIENAKIASRCGWTPYAGMETSGWPVATVLRGRAVMRDGALQGRPPGQPLRFLETLTPIAA